MAEELFVPIEDVAKHFSVSISTVRTWIRSDLIPALKLGGVYRFKISEVEAALRKLSNSGLLDNINETTVNAEDAPSAEYAPNVEVFNPNEDL
jgi:excisionase family DNA binding protein